MCTCVCVQNFLIFQTLSSTQAALSSILCYERGGLSHILSSLPLSSNQSELLLLPHLLQAFTSTQLCSGLEAHPHHQTPSILLTPLPCSAKVQIFLAYYINNSDFTHFPLSPFPFPLFLFQSIPSLFILTSTVVSIKLREGGDTKQCIESTCL